MKRNVRGGLASGLFITMLGGVMLGGAGRIQAGAVDQTCRLDKVTAGKVTFELKDPQHCPPGDLVVREAGRPRTLTLDRALWVAGFGKDRLPAVVDEQVVWLKADGEQSLLQVTRLSSGETLTLGRGGFVPHQLVRSGHYLAIGESHDPLPAEILQTIPHRMVVIDLAAKDHPALLPAAAQPPWPGDDLALEHQFELHDTPGTFWFLLTSLSVTHRQFSVGRWRAGVTQLATFDHADYRSYAYLAIEPTCGIVAFDHCGATYDRTQGCNIVMREVATGRGATLPLPTAGYASQLKALTPSGLSYLWVSQTTYAEQLKTLKFKARCLP